MVHSKVLNQNWDSTKQSLCDISENINEKPKTHDLVELINHF